MVIESLWQEHVLAVKVTKGVARGRAWSYLKAFSILREVLHERNSISHDFIANARCRDGARHANGFKQAHPCAFHTIFGSGGRYARPAALVIVL